MPRSSLAPQGDNRRSIATPLHAVALVLTLSLLLTSGSSFSAPGAFAQEGTPEGAISESVAGTHLDAAISWLLAQQGPDGGFLGFSGEPDPGTTTDAVLALYVASGSDPQVSAALAAAIDYLEENGAPYAATGAGQAAKLALAAVAGGRAPRDFGGTDLVAAMQAPPTTTVENPISGIYGDDLYDHALVLIALVAAGEELPDEGIEPLRSTEGADGGWAFDGSTAAGAADSNTTALVIQALVASGHGDDELVERGLAFLRTLQAPDGSGFAYGAADPLTADANSTALVLQALLAADEEPASPNWGNVPLALVKFQTPSGGLRYLPTDEEPNLLATLQAIPALAGRTLPVARGCAANVAPESDGCIPLALAA